MSAPLADQPAFPARDSAFQDSGVTKRELFAAMAMQGFCSNQYLATTDNVTVARWSLDAADKLIAALEERK